MMAKPTDSHDGVMFEGVVSVPRGKRRVGGS